MAELSLAVKYRPTTFDDVVEQGEVRAILLNQLNNKSIKNAYLFCGGAGTGKTTSARIFANEINQGKGNPIELDAASNNSVDDIRNIISMSKTQAFDSEYKVFILDEVHMLSTGAWNALLKVLEEPPAKSIFIMATTDPQKIPKTILSRVQRYDFKRISQDGIYDRLHTILENESNTINDLDRQLSWDKDALEYIAKIADGGMRDAITLMDKCLAYSTDLTLENVVKALGTADYDIMFDLTRAIVDKKPEQVFSVLDSLQASGKDFKLFIKNYMDFVLDICKINTTKSFEFAKIPSTYEKDVYYLADGCYSLLKVVIELNGSIRWETNPRALVTSTLYLESIR